MVAAHRTEVRGPPVGRGPQVVDKERGTERQTEKQTQRQPDRQTYRQRFRDKRH